jgi:invasion protein IalB
MTAKPSSIIRQSRPLVAAAALMAFGAMPAVAQQAQPRPAQPAQRPAAGAPAAAAPQANLVAVKPEPSQTTWTKVCGKDQGANKEICYTTRDFVSDQGQPVLAVAVYEVKGEPNKIVRFLMPLGLLLQPGARFSVDTGQSQPARFAVCFPNGCFAENTTVTDTIINGLKRGTTLNVSVQNQGGAEVTFQVPLTGFGTAYDGAPIDPKVLEEQQKALQDAMQKQQEELRKRLENTPAAPPAGAAPATPPAGAPAAPKP